jgi:predicted transposase/invertase (TIGR01784 family)
MRRIVNPTSDIFVRFLLGLEENKPVLIDFINTILLDSEFEPVVDLTILNPFNLKEGLDEKESILDIKAKDKEGRVFDVEIQVIGNASFVKRSLYYWAKNYHSQLQESEHYIKLMPVVCINILDFVIFNDIKKAHSCFLAAEKDNPEYVLSEDFQIHFFELPKIDVESSNIFKNRLEKWAYFFKKEGLLSEEEEMQVLIKNDSVMERAHESYKKFTSNDEMLEIYEAREKRIRDEASNIAYAREQGIEQGIKETAIKMLKEDAEISFVSRITNISEESLVELRKIIGR